MLDYNVMSVWGIMVHDFYIIDVRIMFIIWRTLSIDNNVISILVQFFIIYVQLMSVMYISSTSFSVKPKLIIWCQFGHNFPLFSHNWYQNYVHFIYKPHYNANWQQYDVNSSFNFLHTLDVKLICIPYTSPPTMQIDKNMMSIPGTIHHSLLLIIVTFVCISHSALKWCTNWNQIYAQFHLMNV